MSCAGDFHEPVFLYPSFPRTAASLPQSAVCRSFFSFFPFCGIVVFFIFPFCGIIAAVILFVMSIVPDCISGFSSQQVFCVRRFQRRIVVQSFSARRCPAALHPLTAACRKRSVAVFCFRRYSAAYPSFPALSSILPRTCNICSIYAEYMLIICSLHPSPYIPILTTQRIYITM